VLRDHATTVIRPATEQDGPALGRLGAALTRLHHRFDPERFLAPGENIEQGYGRFLLAHMASADDVVFVADRAGEVVGYVWAGVEAKSWKELRDVAGFIHDVLVAEHARGVGIGGRLVEAAAEWLLARGMPRVMLWTAAKNGPAQRLFDRLGFRRTMIEMTRER
jgi:ribosomal protein S18 acetylase RimI-like enzyme